MKKTKKTLSSIEIVAIAAQTLLSPSTVKRVYEGYPTRPSTWALICSAAEKLGYQLPSEAEPKVSP